MVRQNYVDSITAISERELLPLCRIIEPPTCLLGGWAIHFQVNEGFQQAYGREYIGSRDGDLGFHVDPTWTADELFDSPIGQSTQLLTDAGYDPLSFRFVRYFDQETGEPLSEAESRELPSHKVFNLYLDIISDTTDLEMFREVMGFTPPADPLLKHAFSNESATSLRNFREWDIPDMVLIADPDLLAAMKIRSIPDRDREQKRVKDVADLHALLWYNKEYNEIRSSVRSWISDDDLELMQQNLDVQMYEAAANLLQIDAQLMQNSIEQLTM